MTNKYPAGAVVIDALRPVVATDRFDSHGNQILRNHGNGSDCILVDGRLYGADMADTLHEESVRKAAPDLYNALLGARAYLVMLHNNMATAETAQAHRDQIAAVTAALAKVTP